MVQWLCRWESDAQAPEQQAEQARQLGISGWLFELRWHPHTPLPVPPALAWLAEQTQPPLGYGLQWRLSKTTSPAEERAAALTLARWLQPAAARQPLGRPLLVLAGLEHLSHWRFAVERLRLMLRQALGSEAAAPLLLGLRSAAFTPPEAMPLDGQLEDQAGEWQCQRLGPQWNYESHLARAHWQEPWRPPRQAAVLALTPQRQTTYCNASAEAYGAWLQQSAAWSRLMVQGNAVRPWLLLESWAGHRHWWPQLSRSTATRHNASDDTRAATPPAATPPAEPPQRIEHWGRADPQQPALLVHGFHLDVLARLLTPLPAALRRSATLYLSTPHQQGAAAAALLREQGWEQVAIYGCQNRGRDMAPFLEALLPAALAAGHAWALKLHSKRSSHLGDGQAWAEQLTRSLTSPAALTDLARRFGDTPQLGLLAPAGCLLPVGLHLDQNGPWLERLSREQGLEPRWLLSQRFAAGSMYAFRPQALAPALRWLPPPDSFELENGQSDGTLAHALERLMGAACSRSGCIAEELPGSGAGVPGFGLRQALPPAG